jgi:hypothetical protein
MHMHKHLHAAKKAALPSRRGSVIHQGKNLATVFPDLSALYFSIFSAYWRQGLRLMLTKIWPQFMLPSPSSGRPYMMNKCMLPLLPLHALNRWSPPPTVSFNRAVVKYLHTTNQPLMHTFRYSLSWSNKFFNSARFIGPPNTVYNSSSSSL